MNSGFSVKVCTIIYLKVKLQVGKGILSHRDKNRNFSKVTQWFSICCLSQHGIIDINNMIVKSMTEPSVAKLG